MQTKTKDLVYIALMAAIICILAPISIPIPASTVALTLGTFALYLTSYVLEPKKALAATGLYLLLGAIGLPVFSGYGSGIGRFASAGGGYLIGYLFLVAISSRCIHRFPHRPLIQIGGMFLATLVTYSIGTFWMARVIGSRFWATLPAGALVFLPLDTVKIIVSCWLGQKILPYLENSMEKTTA